MVYCLICGILYLFHDHQTIPLINIASMYGILSCSLQRTDDAHRQCQQLLITLVRTSSGSSVDPNYLLRIDPTFTVSRCGKRIKRPWRRYKILRFWARWRLETVEDPVHELRSWHLKGCGFIAAKIYESVVDYLRNQVPEASWAIGHIQLEPPSRWLTFIQKHPWITILVDPWFRWMVSNQLSMKHIKHLSNILYSAWFIDPLIHRVSKWTNPNQSKGPR